MLSRNKTGSLVVVGKHVPKELGAPPIQILAGNWISYMCNQPDFGVRACGGSHLAWISQIYEQCWHIVLYRSTRHQLIQVLTNIWLHLQQSVPKPHEYKKWQSHYLLSNSEITSKKPMCLHTVSWEITQRFVGIVSIRLDLLFMERNKAEFKLHVTDQHIGKKKSTHKNHMATMNQRHL